MWPFSKKKFNHNPEDFRLRIVESWFSNEYIQFEYSTNGGKSWKTIYCAEPPYLGHVDYDWEWQVLTYPLGNGDFADQKQKFSSYQKILDFEKEEKRKFREGQESIERRRREIEEKRLEIFKRATS